MFSAIFGCGILFLMPSQNEKSALNITQEQASKFATLALKNIHREYPNKPNNVLAGPEEVLPPSKLYPAFYGSFDWHSSVHGHWMLVRLLKKFPQLAQAENIRTALARSLTAENLRGEAEFFKKPESKSFERPYGWSWFLKLALELHTWEDTQGRAWAKNLKPLEDLIVKRYMEFFPRQTYPIRSGVHSNTAFGLTFALDYARGMKNRELEEVLVAVAKTYYLKDKAIPAQWEPDGADFFSPSLMEADLMRRILPPEEFATWLGAYYPGLEKGEPATLLQPAKVSDRSDPQIVHLDGLNLSRAWCMASIARALPVADSRGKILMESARLHAGSALEHVSSGDYAGEHWLASFAVYLLTLQE